MNNDFRLYTSKQAFKIYNENCGDGLFPQKSDMFFWCVALGYKNSPDKVPSSLTAERHGEIHWGAFDDEIQKPFLNMVAVEAGGGFEVLGKNKENTDKFRDVIQAYAELGFTILITHMSGHFTDEKLMEIVIENIEI
ncbi:MAG: hypothetical protein OXH57_02485 [Ekhidna sp.]|nr:hypothetical protein [Ekhidna sp.]